MSGGRTLVVFLGSNIGNFDPPGADAFLGGIRASVRPGDALLLGADLVKPEAELLLAYDDPLGVTAAFNRNLLVRVNRELGGDFDVNRFAHRAIWNAQESRVEMHLVSLEQQRVRVQASDVDITFDVERTDLDGEFLQVQDRRRWGDAGTGRVPGRRSVGREQLRTDAGGSGVGRL